MRKFIDKYGEYLVYVFAFMVVVLNVSLMFDNVFWGDEAFSVNTAKKSYEGILQIVYYLDSHPPLYYLYLKTISSIFGYTTWSMHLASIIAFIAGIIVAITVTRRKLGNMPAFAYIVLSGLAYPCCEYNLEIRMYALCFLCVFICANMSLVIFEKNKGIWPWVVMTLVGVVAAYTHYYGLVTTGLLLFMTGVMYFVRNKKLSFLYGLISCVSYLVLYLPWMLVLFKQMRTVKGSWWATEVTPLHKMFSYIFCGERIQWILLPVVVALFIYVLVSERKKEKTIAFYGMITFLGTQALVLMFGYGVSKLLNPIMELRYMYPLVPLTILNLMLGMSKLLKEKKKFILPIVCAFLVIILGLGLWDFRDYRSSVKEQERVSRITLDMIGTPKEGAVFMSTEVQHLSFSVLQCYYPDYEVMGMNGGSTLDISPDCPEIWRFRMSDEPQDIIDEMTNRGYAFEDLGTGHLAKYNFRWFHYLKQ